MKKVKTITAVFLILFYSCENKQAKEESNLTSNYSIPVKRTSLTIGSSEPLKIETNNLYLKLLIDFEKNGKRVKFTRKFKRSSESEFKELKLIKDVDNSAVDSVFLPALLLRDSSFEYVYDEERYPKSIPMGMDDWKYVCKKITDNQFELIKLHLHDSLFKESYLFTKEFELKRVGIYQGSDTLIFEKLNIGGF